MGRSEKLIVPQLLRKFLALHGPRRFIAVSQGATTSSCPAWNIPNPHTIIFTSVLKFLSSMPRFLFHTFQLRFYMHIQFFLVSHTKDPSHFWFDLRNNNWWNKLCFPLCPPVACSLLVQLEVNLVASSASYRTGCHSGKLCVRNL
jgi:hypothetical protein